MTGAMSLRARLTLIILPPVICIALLAGLWQLSGARTTADEVFDKSLLAAAVAVANDVAISGGDALSVRTRDILASTSGGRVFYHVYAPDGVIVAGYATPPVGIPRTGEESTDPTFFDATYLGQDVSGVRLQTRTQVDGFAGLYTTTVWQDSAVRGAFVRDLMLRALVVSLSMLAALVVIVWFGVRLGLRPLLDLEQAIERRSSTDLSAIRRAVPTEVSGVVARLNSLFAQVSRSMQVQSDFIANAAHQLRNPIAGVLALAESVVSAKTPDQASARAGDLLKAAKDTADLSQKLLILERADAFGESAALEPLEISAAVRQWLAADSRLVERAVTVTFDLPAEPLHIRADPLMLREAFANLVDNALTHGGAALSELRIVVVGQGESVRVTFADDGRGLTPEEADKAVERFVHMGETGKSGLGLSIVQAIVDGHGGDMKLLPTLRGLAVEMSFPLVAATKAKPSAAPAHAPAE